MFGIGEKDSDGRQPRIEHRGRHLKFPVLDLERLGGYRGFWGSGRMVFEAVFLWRSTVSCRQSPFRPEKRHQRHANEMKGENGTLTAPF